MRPRQATNQDRAGRVVLFLSESGSAGRPAAGSADTAVRGAVRLLGVPAETLELAHGPAGQPVLQPGGLLDVSISHSSNLLAIALSTIAPIGVDIEAVRPMPAVRLARRCFTEAEAGWVAAHPADRSIVGFLRLWTRKEAIGKALGSGLAGGGLRRPVPMPEAAQIPPLPSVCETTNGAYPVRPAYQQVPGEAGLVVAELPAPAGFVLALACGSQARAAPLEIFRVA